MPTFRRSSGGAARVLLTLLALPLLLVAPLRAQRVVRDAQQVLVVSKGASVLVVNPTNIARWSIEGPWRAITSLGVRRSIRHGDITFGGSPHGGVRVDFRERPKLSIFRPPALYLTVDDLDGFADALAERGIPGADRR